MEKEEGGGRGDEGKGGTRRQAGKGVPPGDFSRIATMDIFQ